MRIIALKLLPALLLLCNQAFAQLTLQAAVLGGSSSTGFHTAIAPMVSLGHHRLYAGPEILLSDSYLPASPVWGYTAGYTYELLSERRWIGTAGVDYQQCFYRPYQQAASEKAPYNTIREAMLQLGLEYMCTKSKKLAIGLYMGSGLLAETFSDIGEGERSSRFGRTYSLRLGVRYKIARL